MKIYRGARILDPHTNTMDTASPVVVEVEEDGQTRELDPRFDLRNHSPTGFQWGYGGSGPAQLALAICVDALGEEAGQTIYQRFKATHVAHWDQNWKITAGEVFDFLMAHTR